MRNAIRLRPGGRNLLVAGAVVAALVAQPAPGRAGGMQQNGPAEKGQFLPVKKEPPHPLSAAAARAWLKLQQPVVMDFEKGAALQDVLDHVRKQTAEAAGRGAKKDDGLTLYVDPVGLQEAEKTLQSPVEMNLKGVPLATSLRLALKQLGLVYSVQKDGLVVITAEGSEDATPESVPVTAAAARTWLKLHETADLKLAEETPFAEALKQIRVKSESADMPHGVQFFVRRPASGESDMSLQAPVTLDLQGVPLATSLDLITSQLGLTYRVRDDGIVVIQEPPDEAEEAELPEGHGGETIARLQVILEETRLKAQIAELRARIENPQMGGAAMGGMMGGGGMGGGGMGGGGMGGGMGGGGMGGGMMRGGMRSNGMMSQPVK